jgi:hypothetical protein
MKYGRFIINNRSKLTNYAYITPSAKEGFLFLGSPLGRGWGWVILRHDYKSTPAEIGGKKNL